MDRRKIDVVLSTLLIIVSLIVLTNDNLVEGGVETELGSMFLPRIIAGLMIIFSVSMAVPSLLKLVRNVDQEENEAIDTTGFLGVLYYISIFVAYWLLVPVVGFLVATPFVMFGIAVLLGGRNWVPMVLMSVITPVLVFYGALYFLRVFLPIWALS